MFLPSMRCADAMDTMPVLPRTHLYKLKTAENAYNFQPGGFVVVVVAVVVLCFVQL